MKIAGKTDIGMVRKVNEDAYAMIELPYAAAAIVCDGMGGAKSGNVASDMAVGIISDKISSSCRPDMSGRSIKNMLTASLHAANITIYNMAHSAPSLVGMGTTAVAAYIAGDTAHIAHVGDSRAYIYTPENGLRQITRDHSIVQNMLESGQLTNDEARYHPKRNVITRALGAAETVDVEYTECELDGGMLLLCTDGLTNFMRHEDMEQVIADVSFELCPERLIQRANKNGGGDNITVVIMKN